MAKIAWNNLTEELRSLGDSTKIVGSPANTGRQTFQPSLGDPLNAPGTPPDADEEVPEVK